MIMVSFYGILTGFSGLLVLNIDSIMINAMLDLSSTGIYAITFFFGTVILIPSRSLLKITSIVIADAWKKNDLASINSIYYKSALNQFVLSSLLFLGIWANIHNIFRILPPEYAAGKYVIFFISLSSVIQMAGGTSNMILFTSPRYKAHTWLMLILVIMLIGTNLLFIPVYGITGAALASSLSFLLFNLLKYLYLNRSFGFSPYNFKFALVILVTIATFEIQAFLPAMKSLWLDIILRSAIITILFLGFLWFFNISDEVKKYLKDAVLYLGRRKR
jgi:O-antigen/teichoic acid export membrane protein